MNEQRPPRVLLTKIGLDGHDRGSRLIAAYLRDAGMEVIYTPPWQTIAAVVAIAGQEDVDVIGVSSLATDHLIIPKLMHALKEGALAHVSVVVGGIIPREEQDQLINAGVKELFGPGASRQSIVGAIHRLAHESRLAGSRN